MLPYITKQRIASIYKDAKSENERIETVKELSEAFNVSEMEIRHILQEFKAYKNKEGKTEKEQYAKALYAVTGISEYEWMKLTLKTQKSLMEILKNG